jgi:hypothetical protein
MRSIVALSLLLVTCAPAVAATPHPHKPRAAVVHSGTGPAVPPAVRPAWQRSYGGPYIPPEENRNLDPSNFGGG